MKLITLLAFIVLATTSSAQWTRTNGPEGGAGYGIFEFNNKLFACTFDGMYVSTDSAASWKSAGLSGKEIFRTATVGSTIFASVDDTLFSTTDEGISWTVNEVFGGIRVQDILVDGGSIYVSVFGVDSVLGGLYNSADSGSTWTKLTTSSTFSYIRSLCSAGNYLIAATRGMGIHRTSDNGTSWEKLTNNLTENPTIWCAESINDTIYIGGDMCFFYSTDKGTTWTIPQNTSLDSTYFFSIYTFTKSGNRMYASIDIQNGVWFSIDNGNNWYLVNGGPSLPRAETAYSLSIIGENCYQQIVNGIFRTSDGGVLWSEHNKGIPTLFSDVGFSDGDTLVAWGPTGLFKTGNGGNTWVHHIGNDVSWIKVNGTIHFSGNNYVYGDAYWQYDNGIVSRFGSGAYDVVHFDTGVVSLTSSGLRHSVSQLFFGNPLPPPIPDSLGSMYKLVSSGTSLIVQCYNLSYDTATWYRSTDGNNWQKVFEGDYSAEIRSSAVHKNVFYIGTRYGGLMRSEDDGLTWTRDNAVDPNAIVDVLYSTGEYLFCSIDFDAIIASNGVSMRKESSGEFRFIGEGLPYTTSLYLHNDGYLYAGSTGIWKRPLAELGIGNDVVAKPIYTIRPNPATDYILVDEDATVTLFTSTGAEVFTTKAVQDERIALPKLASGVYIAKIETKSGVNTAKVIIE